MARSILHFYTSATGQASPGPIFFASHFDLFVPG
jgi:hypothetical protein